MIHTAIRPALIQSLLDQIRQTISLHRQWHIVGVSHTVWMLAARHGLGAEDALLAGLLHDLYKEWPSERLKTEIEGLAGPEGLVPEDRPFPHLWHGQLAGLMARAQWEVDSPGVIEAVTLHTTADAGIGPLAQALFVADYAEPGRTARSAPKVLEIACKDLDEGFREALIAKTRHTRKQGKRFSPRTLRALHAYLPAPMAAELTEAEF